ncbi:hypothetical protein FD15_GL001081 [Liquorilactobacillus sucicola DSM 21376 = JCM 15457]|uniref:L,D-TPase catalytic domain-containing protein n=3 Tax=Liquorilactobacillus sucicola TaxID=519050 RepID=A0A0R2DZ08_9LACO|nr:hypothetical protein FD15_GL001081 [Liquorilactobacillus sucicola DSM 21376 = JCM 15457]
MVYGNNTINGVAYSMDKNSGAIRNIDTVGIKLMSAKFASKTTQTIVNVSNGGSSARVYLYEKDKNGLWQKTLSTTGHVGRNGIGTTHEGLSTTPIGAFSLGLAFGKYPKAKLNTSLAYRQIDGNSYWIEDPKDAQYNTWQERSWANYKNEHLIDYTKKAPNNQYEYAIVINYNTKQIVRNAGSGFFLHVDNGINTAGCVSVPIAVMEKLFTKLGNGAYIVNVNDINQIKNY